MYANAHIGSCDSAEGFKDVAVKFPEPFPEVPVDVIVVATVVLDTARYPKARDRYTVNVSNVTTTGFTARVARVDAKAGWDMNLVLHYSAEQMPI